MHMDMKGWIHVYDVYTHAKILLKNEESMYVFQRMRTFELNVLSRIETKVNNTTAVHLAALMGQNEVQTHDLPSQNNNKKGIK